MKDFMISLSDPIVNPPYVTEVNVAGQGETRIIIAGKYTLSQIDMGYQWPPIEEGVVPEATEHVSIYADTVTLAESLHLPGKNLTIIAREIICHPGVILNVSGASPQKSHKPGDLPPVGHQPENGSNGKPSGHLTVIADQIIDTSGKSVPIKDYATWTSVRADAGSNGLFVQAHKKFSSTIKIPPFEYSYKYPEAKGTMTLNGMWINNLKNMEFGTLQYHSHLNRLTLACEIKGVTIEGSFTREGSYSDYKNIKLVSNPFNCTLLIDAQLSASNNLMMKKLETSLIFEDRLTFESPDNGNKVLAYFIDLEKDHFEKHIKKAMGINASSLNDALMKSYNHYYPRSHAYEACLKLLALGGIGGRGQDGTPGKIGVGAPGGNGGNAGISGTGGKGGIIKLICAAQNSAYVALGDWGGGGGLKATPGFFGLGKPNGKPAKFQGAFGGEGLDGARYVNQVKPTKKNTFYSPPVPSFSRKELGPKLNTEQLLFTQRLANYIYLNAKKVTDFSTASKMYLFLSEVTQPGAMNGLDKVDKKIREKIHSSANAELMRLYRGFDYYGNAYNWAPNLNFEYLQANTVKIMMPLAKNIEDQYKAFKKANKDFQKQIQSAKSSIGHIKSAINALQNNLGQINTEIGNTEKEITILTDQVQQQKTIVKSYDSKLKAAIAAAAPHCQAGTMFEVLNTVCQIGAAAATDDEAAAVKGIVGAIKDAAGKGISAAGQRENIIQTVKTAKANYKAMNEVYQQLKEALSKDPDSGKIFVLEKNFDNCLQPLMKQFSKQAVQLENAVNMLIYITKCRNEKVIQYNGLFAQKAKIENQIGQQEAAIERFSNKIAKEHENETPGAIMSFFRDALNTSYSYLLYAMYAEQRAFFFYSGHELKGVSMSGLNIGAISAAQEVISQKITSFKNKTISLLSPLGGGGNGEGVIFTLDKTKNPNAFRSIVKDKKIYFTIPLDAECFDAFSLIKLEKVVPVFPDLGTPKNKKIWTRFTLSGHYSVIPQGDITKSVNFVCPQRGATYMYNFDTKTAMLEATLYDSDHFRPTPFTIWTMDFNYVGRGANPNEWIDFSKINTIDFHFYGMALAAGKTKKNSNK